MRKGVASQLASKNTPVGGKTGGGGAKAGVSSSKGRGSLAPVHPKGPCMVGGMTLDALLGSFMSTQAALCASGSESDACLTEALIRSDNPHCKQALVPRVNVLLKRLLEDDDPEMVYVPRGKDEVRTVLHWGQRKLFFAELMFLHLSVARDTANVVVIYAGAAPGTHIGLLSEMFPLVTFVLIDPVEFDVKADGVRIITHSCLFTNKLAHELKRKYAGATLLFVSDIRSDLRGESAKEKEQRIKADMQAQMDWHRILRPLKSCLKFRLPYTSGRTRYLDGDVYLPVWGPPSTTECRLVVDTDCGLREYDHGKHERQMSHFNKVTRPALYPHSVRGCGIDHCFDCSSEISILRDYYGVDTPDVEIAARSQEISSRLDAKRTLATPTPRMAQFDEDE